MKELILVRHSNAESESFSNSDFDRKLSGKGIKRAKSQAIEMQSRGKVPDLIITSSAVRAIETADIFFEIFENNCPIKEVAYLYEDFTTSDFFNLINSIDNSYSTVMLVGHNPTISAMAYRLDSDNSISFRPCEISIYNVGDRWDTLEVDGGEFLDVISP